MRMNDQSLVLQYPKILKFPNINYNLSNDPYHEIIDTSIIITNLKTDKEKHFKYQRILNLAMQLLIEEQIAQKLIYINSNKILIPDFKDNNTIIEEMIILETQIQCETQKISTNKEKEAELIIKELLNKIPAIIKDKSKEEVKFTEFPKLREIQNAYRTTVSKLDTAKARCLDMTHEILEDSLNKSKERKKTKQVGLQRLNK